MLFCVCPLFCLFVVVDAVVVLYGVSCLCSFLFVRWCLLVLPCSLLLLLCVVCTFVCVVVCVCL